jgi:hypothetical protein
MRTNLPTSRPRNDLSFGVAGDPPDDRYRFRVPTATVIDGEHHEADLVTGGSRTRRITMVVLKTVAVVAYVSFLMHAAGLGIDLAANQRLLVPYALPAAIVLVVAVRVLGKKAELAGWAAFTVWLGSTYLLSADSIAAVEVIAFLAYLSLGLLGAFRSPYFLALAWLLHPAWDFFPRVLPDVLHDLPAACILFDVPVGLYLLWFARRSRWDVFTFRLGRPTRMLGSGRP